ncbi:MAG TPA: hypothetical protein VGM92_04520, partial [Candidatus Kapabacteria bacterium]
MHKRAFIFVWLSVGFTVSSTAQPSQGAYGKEFYVAFGPNEGGELQLTSEDADEIYITGQYEAHGTVEIAALHFFRSFSTVPGKITTIDLPNGNENASTVELPDTLDEKVISGMAVHITSDSSVAVFGLNHKQYSSDAFLALPNDVLGTEYRTINYKSS